MTSAAARPVSQTGASSGRRRRLAYSLRMQAMILRPWVILLAAGGSSRYGRPKQLVRLDGETLLRRAARIATTVAPDRTIVVLGARAGRLLPQLRGLPLRSVRNPRWRAGLATSLAAGLRALPGDARAALVLLADQPAVAASDLCRLISTWRRAPRAIVAATAGHWRGPPVILPRRCFAG
ncbi:MAG: nucleotidyltransferase family protein, partial [Gammaproteobacteria bacterium]|nr:nucleotidyltransferase family protein [Gammaproteobacteria bacterium]